MLLLTLCSVALVLNGLLTSLYVLAGSVGGLVPFIGTSPLHFPPFPRMPLFLFANSL